MLREQEYQLTPEQEAFLAKARRAAYEDELRPNKGLFLHKSRKFMREAESNGIAAMNPLLLGVHYEIAREAAKSRMRRAS